MMIKKITFSKEFKRDLINISKKAPEILVSDRYIEVIYLLQNNQPLPEKYKDHPLSGNMDNYRDCHIFNDLVLIYRIEDKHLYLSRIGTHSQIFK